VAGGIRSIEKSNDIIGNRTRDLLACSIVPQPTTLPRAPTAATTTTANNNNNNNTKEANVVLLL
jgi:hypothetical protein